MRYSIFFLLILSTFSIESEARLFGRGGGGGGIFRRPLFQRQPMRTMMMGGMRGNSPCGSRGCGSRSTCGPNGCGQRSTCGPNGCNAEGGSQHGNVQSAPAPEPAREAAPEVSQFPAGQRPTDFSQNDSAPLADVAAADPSSAPANTPSPKTKESERADLLAKGWEETTCTPEFCVFIKDGKEKHLFNDGRVEEVTAGTESIDSILQAAQAAEAAEKKPEVAEQLPTQKHGFRYVKGQGLGIHASQLADAIAKEENDGGTSKVLITFGTSWCGPCNKANTQLSRVSSDSNPGITAIKVLVDEKNSPSSTTVPGLPKFPHSSYPTAYVVSKDASGKFTLESVKSVNVNNVSAADIMAQLR